MHARTVGQHECKQTQRLCGEGFTSNLSSILLGSREKQDLSQEKAGSLRGHPRMWLHCFQHLHFPLVALPLQSN